MSLYKDFATDKNLEKTGIVLQYGVTKDGRPIEFIIARAGGANQRFTKVFEQKTKPYKRQIQTDTLPPEVGERLMRETYAETVVLGWNNVEDKDEKPLDFTVPNVLKIFTDLPDLFTDLQSQANKAALFREAIVEADAKN